MKINGKTLNKLYRTAQAKADWLAKLHKNAGKTLARLGRFCTLDRASLNPSKDGTNRITLVYIGDDFDADLPKIERILGARLSDGPVTIQVSRITLEVNLQAPVLA